MWISNGSSTMAPKTGVAGLSKHITSCALTWYLRAVYMSPIFSSGNFQTLAWAASPEERTKIEPEPIFGTSYRTLNAPSQAGDGMPEWLVLTA